MSETQNNIIRFNYSVDPTTLMSNSWITNNTDTTQNTVTGVGGETITHYWRTITFDFSGKSAYAGVFRIEVDENGVPVSPSNFESLSGDEVSSAEYSSSADSLEFGSGNTSGWCSNFSSAIENTVYTETKITGTWSYVASTTTETDYDHYEVELYVNSDVTTFPNNLFFDDDYITSIIFDTYSITSIEDGSKSSGAFFHCVNLASIILPNNIEYIGDYAFCQTGLTTIVLPETLEEIGSMGFNVYNLSITSLATVPPTLNTQSLPEQYTLTIHETALQSYINSDWGNYLTSISTIETPTYDNILKFNYSEDPTEFLKNLWVTSCTDTSANTVVGVGEHTETITTTKHWREVTYTVSDGNSGTVRIGWENNSYTGEFEVVEYEGLIVNRVQLSTTDELILAYFTSIDSTIITRFAIFTTAEENHLYEWSELTPGGKHGTNIYTNTTTTETETVTTYDHYEVTLYINSALNTFETTMFENDTNLLSIELPSVITEITDDAFSGCTNMNKVTLLSTNPPTIGTDTFTGVTATLYVPHNTSTLYRSEYGDIFINIVELPSPVPPTPTHSYGFNLSGMKNVDYGKQGVIILRN